MIINTREEASQVNAGTMRRASRVLALALLLGGLVAAVVPAGAAGKWTGTLVVWDFPRPEAAAGWELAAFKKFEESHPGVKIEYTKLSWAGGGEKLDVAVAAGDPPDICGSGLRLPYVLQGALEPIDPYLTAEDLKDFYEGSLSAVTLNGKRWGWPWYNTVYTLYLNVDLFKERGVPLPENGQWTWREFLYAMQQLTFDRDGDGKIDVYGFGFTIQPTYLQPFGFIYAEGGRILSTDGKEFVLDRPEAVAGIKRLYDMVWTYKCALPGAGGMTTVDVHNAFLNSRTIAAFADTTGIISAFTTHNQKVEKGEIQGQKINLVTAGYPRGSTGLPVAAGPGVGSWAVFKQKDPAKRDVVMELARFLTSGKSQKEVVPLIGTFPSRKSAGNVWAGHPYLERVAPSVEYAVYPPMHPEWAKIDEKIMKELQLAMLGEKTIEAALRDAKRQVERFLRP